MSGLAGFLFLVLILGASFARGVGERRAERQTWAAKGREKALAAGASSYAALVRSRMKDMVLPTLWLAPATTPGASRLGGTSDLPAGADWPMGEKRPREFLALIDLAEIRTAGGPSWLPAAGRIHAFYDGERQGCADLVKLIYTDEPSARERFQPRVPYPERFLSFLPAQSLPSLDWLNVDPREIADDPDEAAWAPFAEIERRPVPRDAPEHRIGGYPSEIQPARMPLECEHLARGLDPPNYRAQTDPAIERAATTWRLLLQIDSDDELKMNWVDGGRLYIFIREDDARGGDFAKTVTLSQFY